MRLICCILSVVVVSCAPLSYIEPTSGPTARVRFVTTSSDVTVLWRYSDADCVGEEEMMRLRNGILANSSTKRLGIPLWTYKDNQAKEVLVDSSRPFVALFSASGTEFLSTYSCGLPFMVSLMPDLDYEIVYKADPAGRCRVEMSQIVVTGEQTARVSVGYSNLTNAAGCKAAIHKSRLY